MKTLENVTLSFAGCGFLGIYQVGAAICFEKYAPRIFKRKMSGASSGALVAAALICGCSTEDCTKFVMETILETKAHILGPFSPNFHIVEDMWRSLDKLLPDDCHIRASGQLHISMTRFPDFKNVVVSEFDSKEELIQALICSSFIPLYSGLVLPKYRGHSYFDGALSNNMPVFDENTAKVCPFAGESDISPDDQSKSFCFDMWSMSTQVSLKNIQRMTCIVLPLSLEKLADLCRAGYQDTLKFLQKHDMIRCYIHEQINTGNEDCFYCNDIKDYSINDSLPSSVYDAFHEASKEFDEDTSLRAKICKFREFLWIACPLIFPCSYAYSACRKILNLLPNASKTEEMVLDIKNACLSP